MDLFHSMRVFVQVIDSGGFSAAARRVGASPTTVTHHVQALEKHLGVQLIHRTTRSLSLTEVGRTFYERTSRILAQVEEVESCASDLRTTPRGLLRIGTSDSMARAIGPLMVEFNAAYPNISFDVVVGEYMVDPIEAGFDLVLRGGCLPDSSLIGRRLGVARLILCAAPAYLERRGAPRGPEDLADHNCLIHPFVRNHWRLTGSSGTIAIDVAGNLHSNSWDVLRRGALLGQGITLMPIILAAADIRDGGLTRVLPDYDSGDVVIQAIYPASRHLSVKVRTFIDFLVSRLDERPALLGRLPREITEVAA
jgi:DNA-binding transcriptional LysR family regulator